MPDGVDVAARTGVAGADLLRRQVCRGAQDDAGGGDLGLGDGAHQTEVGDLDLAVVGDQHVLRLDVAVHQPGRGVPPPVRRARAQHRGDGVRRHRPAFAQQLPQRAALDELHHQKRDAGRRALVVDGDQAGILQPGDSTGLALKPGQELVVAGIARVHDFSATGSVQPDVHAAVHRGHAAGGDHVSTR